MLTRFQPMPVALAVDIGGTKFEVATVTDTGEIGGRARVDSTGASDAEELFGRLAGIVESFDLDPVDVCGVGSGGPMLPNGEEVSPLNIGVWRDFPLRSRVAELTGLPTFVDNDAKALALAEGWLGAAVGVSNYIAMVVSTGVGGGIVLNNKLLDGALGNAGHIGHVVVEPEGTELPGHVRGVLEGEASGTAIAFRTGAPASEAPADERARAGTMVGRAVGSVANLLDLQLAVVAGSVALGYGGVFFEAAQLECDRVAQLQHSVGTRIVPAGLAAEGPLIGAAAVGFSGSGHRVGEQ
ncbi:MAG: ROK family protein [Acidimicrobiaceae bacterium]|nr:ROK family protein [Acidimicrobiaceae bacterium]MYA73938.1 ROK family protein [Acidimicrobiaceae bacterium]MYC42217.1 ROK family protein [Acidimicrobiaceae bacterium]MYG54962.1 ROK family protein [Acidimicrobiaceae bacterium]MYH88435.1 ROK family protein [Acidimicrobiaceae bacterium]